MKNFMLGDIDPANVTSIEGILESFRSKAAEEAKTKTEEIKKERVEKLKNKRRKGSLGKAMENIKEGSKNRMRTVQHYLCDCCDNPISSPEDGFVIHGNIYVADPDSQGGLVGNNFPESEQFAVDEINKVVYCKTCFLDALGIDPADISKSEACWPDYMDSKHFDPKRSKNPGIA